jgi:hypothetical protein
MAIDEQHLRIRRSLEEKLGVEEASYLMDRPLGGWSALVTSNELDAKFDAKFAVLDERFRGIDERFRAIDERFRAIDVRFDLSDQRTDHAIAALRHELLAVMERGFRRQTWAMLGVLVPGFCAVFAAVLTVSGR